MIKAMRRPRRNFQNNYQRILEEIKSDASINPGQAIPLFGDITNTDKVLLTMEVLMQKFLK